MSAEQVKYFNFEDADQQNKVLTTGDYNTTSLSHYQMQPQSPKNFIKLNQQQIAKSQRKRQNSEIPNVSHLVQSNNVLNSQHLGLDFRKIKDKISPRANSLTKNQNQASRNVHQNKTTASENSTAKCQFVNFKTQRSHDTSEESRQPPNLPQQAQIRQFVVKNIVNSCFEIEMTEQHENKHLWRELDKEKVLGDLRNQKLKKMYAAIKEADIATDPMTLKQMFVYKNLVDEEYEEESRQVMKEYMQEVIDPLRQVARIELKGNRQRKVVQVSGMDGK